MSSEHPFSPVWMGTQAEREAEICFPDKISGPPVGWRSAVKRVAMFLDTMEDHSGGVTLWE